MVAKESFEYVHVISYGPGIDLIEYLTEDEGVEYDSDMSWRIGDCIEVLWAVM